MSTLANKVDFEVIISATDANPNGDPCCLPRKTQKVGNHGISRN